MDDTRPFADEFHLPLSQALGEDRIFAHSLDELGVDLHLLLKVVQFVFEFLGLIDQASVLVGLRNQQAAGKQTDSGADENKRPAMVAAIVEGCIVGIWILVRSHVVFIGRLRSFR